MEGNLKTVELRDLSAGIQARSSDLAIEGEFQYFPLRPTSINWSFGKYRGLTTRYGIMPIAGHNSKDMGSLATVSGGKWDAMQPRNLIASEDVYSVHKYANVDYYELRTFIYGCVILQLPIGVDNAPVPVTYWITCRAKTGTGYGNIIDLVPTTPYNAALSGNKRTHTSQYEDVVGDGTACMSFLGDTAANEANYTFYSPDRLHTTKLSSLRLIEATTAPKYIIYAQAKVSLVDRTQDCAMAMNMVDHSVDPGAVPSNADFYSFGMPYSFYNQNKTRKAFGYSIGTYGPTTSRATWQTTHYISSNTNDLNSVKKLATPNSNYFGAASGTFITPNNNPSAYNYYGGLLFASTNATFTKTDNWAAGSKYFAYMEFTNDAANLYQATFIGFVAGGKPIVALYNELLRESTTVSGISYSATYDRQNDYIQWIDPTSNMYKPRTYSTYKLAGAAASDLYTETVNAVTSAPIQTCFMRFPLYSDAATSTGVTANKGILSSYTSYEITYSIYNSLTGKESNVGKPAKIYTNTIANGAFFLQANSGAGFESTTFGGSFTDWCMPGLPDIENNGSALPVNMLSYRFYYREIGSFEWVFATEVSFAKMYFLYSNAGIVAIGTGEGIGLPAGQPGGYIDNSDLPQDIYIDVKSFARRMWWLTKNSIRFSTRDNLFVYPLRNSVVCDSDEFRGSIVHYFPGQAEQFGRLVVFGSKNQYDIRETNIFQYQQVRVSPTAAPQTMPVPDSNISIAVRSNNTAFSGRCAAVAEGVLFFWGPNGVFRDDGVGLPTRISEAIEPDIFSSYDKSKTDEFFAYYNKRSREVLFFFRPASTSDGYLTRAWVYSLRHEGYFKGEDGVWTVGPWTQYAYKSTIDWAQDLDLTGFLGGTAGGSLERTRGGGSRVLIGIRNGAGTISRPYFHDDDCDCGDYSPGNEMMVKTVERVNASTVKLTFTSDHNTTIRALMTAGTTVYIQGAAEYAGINLDGAQQVSSTGSGFIIINNSDAGIVGTTNLNFKQYFPVFESTYHKIACQIDTNYFAPYGVTTWAKYRYMHMLIQPVTPLYGSVSLTSDMSWNCNHTLTTSASKNFSVMKQNTREATTQVIFDMQSPGMQSEGQGISFNIVYNQIGGRWTLYALTLWHSPFEGKRNLLMYQQ